MQQSAVAPAPVFRPLSAVRLHQLRLAARIARSDPENVAAFSSLPLQGVQLASAYADCSSNRSEPPFTNLTSTFADCLDYIFYTRSSQHPMQNAATEAAAVVPTSASSASAAAAASRTPIPTPMRIVVQEVHRVTEGAGLDMESIQRSLGGAAAGPNSNSSSSSSSLTAAPLSLPLPLPRSLTTCLPNSVWPSDHLMLTARFTFESVGQDSSSTIATGVSAVALSAVRTRQKLFLLDAARLEARITKLAARIEAIRNHD